jgi:hypothetical protein
MNTRNTQDQDLELALRPNYYALLDCILNGEADNVMAEPYIKRYSLYPTLAEHEFISATYLDFKRIIDKVYDVNTNTYHINPIDKATYKAIKWHINTLESNLSIVRELIESESGEMFDYIKIGSMLCANYINTNPISLEVFENVINKTKLS